MALVEVSIVPIGTGDSSVSSYVAGTIEILHRSGLPYEITSMGTIINGPIDEIFRVIREMQENCFAEGAKRIYTVVKIDDRRDKEVDPEKKLESLREKLMERGILT